MVGSAAVDITAQAQAGVKNALIMHSTAPGTVSMSLGGVARNIAEAAHRVITLNSRELSSLLVSAIGDDHFGRLLTNETTGIGMRVDGLVKNDKQTPVCNMVLDSSGGLIGGITDMGGPRTATLDKDTVRFLVFSSIHFTHRHTLFIRLFLTSINITQVWWHWTLIYPKVLYGMSYDIA